MVHNIKNNAISAIDAKKKINELSKIKNSETIKYKKCTPKHKKLLNIIQ